MNLVNNRGALAVLVLIALSASGVAKTVNVRRLGATGSGSVDDTPAIQRAISTISSGGGTVYFPCGTYLITAELSITASNTLLTGAPDCVTLRAGGSKNFIVIKIAGEGLGPRARLLRDTTTNTFTLEPGGIASLGLQPGDYAVISDEARPSNGPGSPLISTQQVLKITAVNGDTATISGAFAHNFTLISPYPANQGGRPYVEKIRNPLRNVGVTHLNLDGSSNTGSVLGAIQMAFAVESEIAFVKIANFLQTPGPSNAIRLDSGYGNRFHDIVCNACGNGSGHSLLVNRESSANFTNITIKNTASQSSFGFNLGSVNNSSFANVTVDGGGADGRPIKLLRSNHNTFDHIEADNGGDGKNGISITDMSTYNTFDHCVALSNSGTGIMMFGSYDVHNSFSHCVAKYNSVSQFGQGMDAFGDYGDDFTTVTAGVFCCARGKSNIVQINSNDFTMEDTVMEDDRGLAPCGLVISGARFRLRSNVFRGLKRGRDVLTYPENSFRRSAAINAIQ